MENLKETYKNSENTNDPNATSHYVLLTIGMIIGFTGIFSRFIIQWEFMDIIANVLLIIGVMMSLKAVVDVLK